MFNQLSVAAVMVVWVSASAMTVAAHEKSEQMVIKPREFTIPKGLCSQLPAGLEVKGLGIERAQTVVESFQESGKHEREDDDARISFNLSSRITGTATDNFGGQYTFKYELRFNRPIALPGSGVITDTFRLTGSGAADGLSTFFRARVTLDSGSTPIGFEILEQAGDPASPRHGRERGA